MHRQPFPANILAVMEGGSAECLIQLVEVFQPFQWPGSERQNALDFYIVLWVNVLLILDICPRKMIKGFQELKTPIFLFVFQSYRDTTGSPYKVYEL